MPAAATVKVAYVPLYTAGILSLAEKKGFFKEQNLTVELSQVPAPPAAVAAVSGGQVQFAYSPSIPLIRAASNGVGLMAAAAADGFDPAAVAAAGTDIEKLGKLDDTAAVASPASGITSIKGLEGKTVSVPARGAQLEVTISAALKEAGGDPAKIKWVALGFPEAVAALKAGRIDAAGLVSPFTQTAVKNGGTIVVHPAVTFFGGGAVGVWLTSSDFAKSNADVVSRFKAAIDKTNAYAMANLEEFYPEAAAITDTPLADVKAGPVPYFPTEIAVKDLQNVNEKMVELGAITAPVDVATLIFK
jgi:NitT/TauT family transport system substrate-binding protein